MVLTKNYVLTVGFDEAERMYLEGDGTMDPFKFSIYSRSFPNRRIFKNAINRYLKDLYLQDYNIRKNGYTYYEIKKVGQDEARQKDYMNAWADSLNENLENIIFVTPNTLDKIYKMSVYYGNDEGNRENELPVMGVYVYGRVDLGKVSFNEGNTKIFIGEGSGKYNEWDCKSYEKVVEQSIVSKTVFLSLERIDTNANKNYIDCNELRYMVLSHEIGHAAFQNVNLVNKTYQSTDFKDKAMHETQANFFSSFSAKGRLDVEIRRKIAMQSSIYQYPVLLKDYSADRKNKYKNYFQRVNKLF